MKRFTIIFFIVGYSVICLGQNLSEMEMVQAFKKDHLKGSELFKLDTLVTSDAILTRCRLRDYREITTHSKKENKDHYEYYFNDTDILEMEFTQDPAY